MKRFLLRTLSCLLCTASAAECFAARQTPTTGTVVDPGGVPVACAAVVLLDGGAQLAGTVTGADGSFSLEVPAGTHRLTIRYLGYETFEKDVETPGDLGRFVLQPATVAMQEVVVEAGLVRREADRFVMDIANSPAAAGKDGTELLKQAPGVWLTDDKIAVNGSSGVKIYINDREMRMSTEQLLNYLHGLKAEEIQRIEIIPQAGADYDADSAAGIIKITLKRQRDNGMAGNLSFSTRQSRQFEGYNPTLTLSGHANRWTFDTYGWVNLTDQISTVAEHTDYLHNGAELDASSRIAGRNNWGGGRIGTIFDISDRHSIGAEADLYLDRGHSPNRSSADFRTHDLLTRSESLYDSSDETRTFSATFNYIWRIDTLGSTLKVMADYSRNSRRQDNDNFSRSTAAGIARDSTFDNRTRGLYEVATLNIALDKRLGTAWHLRTGAKYTCNDMHNEALYRYLLPEGWQTLDSYSYVSDYTERIWAVYAAATLKKGRWSAVAGLRGEYTRTTGYASDIRQRYFSLFPNANVSCAFGGSGTGSLTMQYSRNISRPSFWVLNPMRLQISDYTYQSGNPDLLPSYSDNLSLTAVFAGKYSLSIGARFQHDEICQVFGNDAADPSITNLRYENLDHSEQYYATVSLPVRFARWWSLDVDLTGLCRRDRISTDTPRRSSQTGLAQLKTIFTLPRKIFIEAEYFGQSRYREANLDMKSFHSVTLGLKKRLLDDRLTLSAQVVNLFDRMQHFAAATDNSVRSLRVVNAWQPRRFELTINYNFKTGKAFKTRKIESGAGDEKGRM